MFLCALVVGGTLPSQGTTPAGGQLSASFPTSPESTAVPDSAPLPTVTTSESAPASSAPSASPASSTPSAIPKPSKVAAGLVAGTGVDAPIQKLFASSTASLVDRSLWDIHNPASPLVLVNKQNALAPLGYTPSDLLTPNVLVGSAEPALLRAEVAGAAAAMFAAAATDGVHITVASSFRSYSVQTSLYNGYTAQKGQAEADTSSARPGFSEHQSGLSLDIGDADVSADCMFTYCMAQSPAGKWVAAHGADYGFIVRYPVGSEAITGYLAEPWHLRYLGVAVAQDMRARKIPAYETYLGLPSAPAYK